MQWTELVDQDPDIIVVLPCGWDIERASQDMHYLTDRPQWRDLKAVKSRQVFIVDGNQYFNRPGPRIVDSLEIFAEIFHAAAGQAPKYGHRGRGWKRWN